MRASCPCNSFIATFWPPFYIAWQKAHAEHLALAEEEDAEERPDVYDAGHSDNQLSHQDNTTYDGMKYVPEVQAVRIGFQPE